MTDTIAGLIERLRVVASGGHNDWLDTLVTEAAEALARLTAELAECDKLATHHSDRAETAEAEVATLNAQYRPSMTDLMVPPETIAAFMEANPLPPEGLTLETMEEQRAMLKAALLLADKNNALPPEAHLQLVLLRDIDAQAAHIATLTARLATETAGAEAWREQAHEWESRVDFETAAREAAEATLAQAQDGNRILADDRNKWRSRAETAEAALARAEEAPDAGKHTAHNIVRRWEESEFGGLPFSAPCREALVSAINDALQAARAAGL